MWGREMNGRMHWRVRMLVIMKQHTNKDKAQRVVYQK